MELLLRETYERKGRRQRKLGKGPASPKPVRLTEVTEWRAEESQVMPTQLQGVLSRSFHEESD